MLLHVLKPVAAGEVWIQVGSASSCVCIEFLANLDLPVDLGRLGFVAVVSVEVGVEHIKRAFQRMYAYPAHT